MRGVTHAVTAGAAYAAAGVSIWHQPVPLLLTGTAIAIGAGVLPDLDTARSAVALSFGKASQGLAWVVAKISGGHRKDTHTAIGDGACALLALGAIALEGWHRTLRLEGFTVHYSVGRVLLWAYLGLLLGAGAMALHVLRRHKWWREGLALAAAAALAGTGYAAGSVGWAILIGTAVHAMGDELTKHGVAYLAPITQHRFHLLPQWACIETGGPVERRLIMPAASAALVLLLALSAYHAAALPSWPAL